MGDLRRRFGRLVAAHRRKQGLTQEALAEAADLSLNMIGKIEAGATGARFAVIERLATALSVDAAELFTTELPKGMLNRGDLAEILTRLALLSEADLVWMKGLLDAALRPRSGQVPTAASERRTTKQRSRGR